MAPPSPTQAGSPYFDPTLETMPPEERLSWLNVRLAQVVAHAYAHAPAVRRVFQGAGLTPADVTTVADLDKVPITRKDDLVELQRRDPPFGGFLGVPLTTVKRVYQSPGPLYEPEGDEPDYWRWAQALYAAGFRTDDIVQNTAAYTMTPLGFMLDNGLRALGCTVVPAGPGNTKAQIQMIRELGVTGYVGMPSFLMRMIEEAEKEGVRWQQDTQLRKAFVIAEPFPPSLRRAFAERDIVAHDAYGTAETGNLGFECGHGRGWHIPYDVIVQVVDLNSGRSLPPGAEGEIVVTLLTPVYPLIRFGTGDLSALDDSPCPCGRTTLRLLGWLGRVGQAVKVRGLFVHPRQLAQAIQRFPAVARFQAVVDRPKAMDRLTVRVEPKPDADLSGQAAAIGQALQEVLKLQAVVEVVPPGTISPDAPPLEDRRTWD